MALPIRNVGSTGHVIYSRRDTRSRSLDKLQLAGISRVDDLRSTSFSSGRLFRRGCRKQDCRVEVGDGKGWSGEGEGCTVRDYPRYFQRSSSYALFHRVVRVIEVERHFFEWIRFFPSEVTSLRDTGRSGGYGTYGHACVLVRARRWLHSDHHRVAGIETRSWKTDIDRPPCVQFREYYRSAARRVVHVRVLFSDVRIFRRASREPATGIEPDRFFSCSHTPANGTREEDTQRRALQFYAATISQRGFKYT